jgi:hypothetical protein
MMLRKKADDDILGLPTMEDRLDTKAVKLIMHMSSYCLMKDQGDTAVYSALLALKLTLKRGLSPHSATALTIWGATEVAPQMLKAAIASVD